MENTALKVVEMPEVSRREKKYREREEQFLRACDGIGRGTAGTPGARPAAVGVRPGTCSGKRRKSPPEVDTAGGG